MNTSTDARDLMHLVIEEIWNSGDLERANAVFTHDYVNHGGLIPDIVRGPEAIKLSVALYRSAFPGFQLVVDEVTLDKAEIVLRWVAHRGRPSMRNPTKAKGDLRGITRCRLQGDKIAESWTVWDTNVALLRLSSHTQEAAPFQKEGVKSAGRRDAKAQRWPNAAGTSRGNR